MGLFVLAQVAWNGLAVKDRVDLHAQLPDVVKTLDVVYNLKSATSSSERVQIWSWTLSNMHAVGEGSGSWKWAAEGFCKNKSASATCPFGVPTRTSFNGFTSWGGCRSPC